MREKIRALRELASLQGGYFTAKDAKEVGYDYHHLHYHVAAGNFEKAGHGLYRVAGWPYSDHYQYIELTLWSRDRKGEPQAVVSHETALRLYDLTELMPHKIHLTVPPGFRKTTPPGAVLHKGILNQQDCRDWGAFRVTTPLRSFLDSAASGVSQEQIEKGLDDALTRGLVNERKLHEALQDAPAAHRIWRALDGIRHTRQQLKEQRNGEAV